MTYKKRLEKALEKIYNFTPGSGYDEFINKLSTGGPIERSYKKRIGDMTHKKGEAGFVEKYYAAVDKVYKNIYKDKKNDDI